jgi:hypothetical protein
MRILRRFLARVKIFAMGQRSREFDIRIAVGATRGNVMAVVFHQGLLKLSCIQQTHLGPGLRRLHGQTAEPPTKLKQTLRQHKRPPCRHDRLRYGSSIIFKQPS